MFDELKWRSMTAAINQIPAKPSFLQDMIFKTRNSNMSDTVDVDVIIGGKALVPFVTPIEGGIVVDKLRREMRTVKTPRIRPKKPFNAPELLQTRDVGAGFYGTAGDISKYRQKKLALELEDLKNRIGLTTEWMSSEALKGTLTVSQDNLAFQVDYLIPNAHKPDISAQTYKWNGTPDILGNIDEWANLIINAIGIGPDMAICGKNVVNALRKDEAVLKLLDNNRVQAGSLGWKVTSNYMGNLNGIDLYRYGTTYQKSDGSTGNFVDDDAFILIATSAKFTIEFGSIMDLEAEAAVVGEFFSKSWLEKDPSVLWILAESRPLPVPWQPEAIVNATVTG